MSSVTGPKNYDEISRQLDMALDHVGKAEGTKDPTRKGHLDKADQLLDHIGKELLSSKEVVEGHGSILKVLEKYNHVLKKYEEASTIAESNENIVQGAPLEKVKLFFNTTFSLLLGSKERAKRVDKALDLLNGKLKGEGDKTVKVDIQKIEKDYKQLHGDLLRSGKVDQGALQELKDKLALLRNGLVDYGVEGKDKEGNFIGKTKVVGGTDFQNLKQERSSWKGAGALRRKLVIELAKVTSLEARLEALGKAEAPEGVPEFKSHVGGIKASSAAEIETTVIKLRTALEQVKAGTLKGVTPEQVGRMELALKQYTDAFNEKMDKLVKLDQKFSVGEIIGKDPKQIDESIALAKAKFFTFNDPHDPQAGIYLGKLTAYLVLTSDQPGNQQRLEEIRSRLDTDPQRPSKEAMEAFQAGFKSILLDRVGLYQSGTARLEGVISKLVSTYATATVSEKTLIGDFLDNKVESLPANAIPAVVMMRLTSALQAPSDVKLRDTATGVMLKMVIRASLGGRGKISEGAQALLSYLGKEASKDQVEAFSAALVKRAIEDFPNTSLEELYSFRQALASLQSKVPGLISVETEKALNSALGLGVKAQLQAAFEGDDPKNAEAAFSFAGKFTNVFLKEHVQGLTPPLVLINRLNALLKAAPEPTDVRRAPENYKALEKELQLALALFPDNSEIKGFSDELKAKQEALQKEMASRTPWTGVDALSARLQTKKTDVAAIQSEMQKAIDGVLVRKDSEQLLRIEADLEKMRVNPDLSAHRGIVEGLITNLQDAIKKDQTLSFNKMKALIETKLPATPPSGKRQWEREDIRTLLSVVKDGGSGERLEQDARTQIANALNSREKLVRDSIGVKALQKLIQEASGAKPPRDIVAANAMALLRQVTNKTAADGAYGGYKARLAKVWEFDGVENPEGLKPANDEQRALLGAWKGVAPAPSIKATEAQGVADLNKHYEALKDVHPLPTQTPRLPGVERTPAEKAEDASREIHYQLIELYSTEIVHIANLQRLRDALPTDATELRELFDTNIKQHRLFLDFFVEKLEGKNNETFKKEMPAQLAQFDLKGMIDADIALNKELSKEAVKFAVEEDGMRRYLGISGEVVLVGGPGNPTEVTADTKLVEVATSNIGTQTGFIAKRATAFELSLGNVVKQFGKLPEQTEDSSAFREFRNKYQEGLAKIDEFTAKAK